MPRIIPSGDNSIFALDIGTRSVIGIVALVESGVLRVAAQCSVEHESRSMYDGQIHDISRVADTVMEVKSNLEKKVGFKLTRAAIAAAGRSLITRQCRVEMEVDDGTEIDGATVDSLEIAGIKKAQDGLGRDEAGGDRYFCVGYSVVRYYLNNYPISNLVGHVGKTIGADVLATFLPESVVNSLHSVLRRVGLEPVNLTLEPIAAIEVVIPENVRLLNLALIDIGAGTSDIAITRKGSVVSYGMVPFAGDEVTEAISEGLLVSFNEAEKIKRSLERGGTITYRDILGMENTTTAEEVAGLIDPVLDKHASEVAEVILNLNGGEPPRTAFCVGGGSRLPGLTAKLAGKLGIEQQKVAVRGRDAIQNLAVDEDGLEGPEGVTVVGIATVAIKKLGQNFIKVKVDGKEFSLFNSTGLTVSNVLSAVDFNPRDLIGHNGRNLKFSLNGRPQTIYGSLAKPAEIYINGRRASLKSPVKEGDEIKVLRAVDGDDARMLVGDVIGGAGKRNVVLNGEPKALEPVCLLNGERAQPDCEIKDGDRLEISWTAGDIFGDGGLAGAVLLVNGRQADHGYELEEGDEIKLVGRNQDGHAGTAASPGAGQTGPEAINVTVNGEKIRMEGKKQYIFVDIFNYIDFDRSYRKGTVVLKVNGSEAGYTDVLKEGDSVEIYWEEAG
ncbi:MAG TPA: cell division FtsA domain-containing protein [Bacillota bacterium]|nr:cell division FtsA domain-containing protein [Bacillota bacterium]